MDTKVKEYLDQCKQLKAEESHLRGYQCPPDDIRDEARIEGAIVRCTAHIEQLKAAIAATPADIIAQAKAATVSYPCAGAMDGCSTRVRRQGDYCRRCAFDEE